MPHVDEGTLHAYLDGELDAIGIAPTEVAAHIALCAECRARLGEARRIHSLAATVIADAAPAQIPVPPFERIRERAKLKEDTMDAHALPPPPALKARFKHLPASEGGKRKSWSAGTVTFSVVAHAALLAGAIFAATITPQIQEKEEEQVTFVDIQEVAPEPEPEVAEPEPPSPPPEAPPAAPPPPRGFQELVPPREAPPEIPDVDVTQKAVRAEDFTGVGQRGGTAKGVEGGVPQNTQAMVLDTAPVFQIEETGAKPELTNTREVIRALERSYPRMYQDAGVGGSATLRFVINKEGKVDPETVSVVTATNDAFGEAATKALERFKFKPVKYRGEAVRVWAMIPITFNPPQ